MDDEPLAGKTILVAGSEDRVPSLTEALTREGASVIPIPTIRIIPPDDVDPLDEALRNWASFDWVVFTTAHGVSAVAERARVLHVDLRQTRGRIAAIGPVTRAALQRNGLPADAVPAEYVTDAIADTMGDVAGKRILLPRSRSSRQSLPDTLRSRGAEVVQVNAFEAVPAEEQPEAPLPRSIDLVVFTSPSSAENLSAIVPENDLVRLLERTPAATIGPVTAEAARALGFRIAFVAPEHTIDGLVKSLVELEAHDRDRS
jgi:uroporphyrinogen III methyltransferase/synthase